MKNNNKNNNNNLNNNNSTDDTITTVTSKNNKKNTNNTNKNKNKNKNKNGSSFSGSSIRSSSCSSLSSVLVKDWGRVRATPYGSCLTSMSYCNPSNTDNINNNDNNNTKNTLHHNNSNNKQKAAVQHLSAKEFHNWREENCIAAKFVKEGYDHHYGRHIIDDIDQEDDNDNDINNNNNYSGGTRSNNYNKNNKNNYKSNNNKMRKNGSSMKMMSQTTKKMLLKQMVVEAATAAAAAASSAASATAGGTTAVDASTTTQAGLVVVADETTSSSRTIGILDPTVNKQCTNKKQQQQQQQTIQDGGKEPPPSTTTTTTTMATTSTVLDDDNVVNNNNGNIVEDDDNNVADYIAAASKPIKSLHEKWRLIPYFLSLRSLLRQHIDSFDNFINREIREIIFAKSNVEIRSEYDSRFYLRYTNYTIGKPSIDEDSYTMNTNISPNECRLRDCSYSAPIYVNIRYTRGRQIVNTSNVMIGRIPIMLRSKRCMLYGKSDDQLAALRECPHDPGGYFVIKGVEKVILIQEQLSKNRVIIEREDTATGHSIVSASITSSTNERKSKAYIIVKNDNRIYLKSNSLGEDIPICIVMKAIGIESDLEIVQLVVGNTTTTTTTKTTTIPNNNHNNNNNGNNNDPVVDVDDDDDAEQEAIINALALSLEEPVRFGIATQKQALRYIGQKIRGRISMNTPAYGNNSSNTNNKQRIKPHDEAREVLANVVLSHIPVENYDFRNKALYIGNIVRRVLLVHLGLMELDDKDYYGNKRLELAGSLLSLLFEDLFKTFNRDLKRQAEQELSRANKAQAFDIVKCIRSDHITYGMISAISSGNWVLKRFRMDRAGVTQVLTRLSYMSALGMMTRINSQFEKTRKVSGPRSLQSSQWGMLCPADTPEGEACGLVKALALLSHISTEDDGSDIKPIERLCRDLGLEDVCRMTGHELYTNNDKNDHKKQKQQFKKPYLIFLNGLMLGVHTNPNKFVNDLRFMRRNGMMSEFVSIYLNEQQLAVHIATDGGRVCRPLLIVEEEEEEEIIVHHHRKSKQPSSSSSSNNNNKSSISKPIITTKTRMRTKLRQHHIEALSMGMMDITDLLKQGIVEYVDCNEENNTLIAVTEKDLIDDDDDDDNNNDEQNNGGGGQDDDDDADAAWKLLKPPKEKRSTPRKMKYTHCEIDPYTILGVVGGIIPFPHHNQSPRNTYTVAMAKQAMGNIGKNQYQRMDGLIYTLVYPQKPMVKSRTLDLVHFDEIPGGQNACIAVMSYSGYDIEDAIILNKAAIDRGFGRCMVLRKHQTSIRRYANGTMDRTCGAPDPSSFPDGANDKRYKKYQAIDKDGICRVGEYLESGSCMVNKESPMDTANNNMDLLNGMNNAPTTLQYKPCGLTYKGSAPVYVDKVLITSNEHEQFLIKVMIRQVRRPEIGDKFASRHGQKGVCGLIVQEADLPFNELGHPPDLIMNPHGFPSRMTVGKLLEMLVGKAGVYVGRQGYSTAFGEELGSADTAEAASEALIRCGLNYSGKDILYSGQNGEPLDSYIFTGPVFYQKLKHMVLDKAHARARGPRAVLTRQPTEGRSRDGGLRLGEMERDCLIAYGVSNLIMERLMHSSDAFLANVCLTCGLLQYKNWCQHCRSGEDVADIRIPYACKLLFQELQAMNVVPRLQLRDHA